METLLGIIIGIIATVIVSRYYFNRTINKQLTPYLTLSTRIFAGIEKSVREQLKFTFRETEVTDLHQLEFLIANDGERAVSNFIEPLTLELPDGVQVLDASLLYQYPATLQVEVSESKQVGDRVEVTFKFPLLNKGEFFLVKLLLSGSINNRDLNFRVVSDDLPRTIRPKRLPLGAMSKKSSRIEWGAVVAGVILLAFNAVSFYTLSLLYPHRPDLFPYPFKTFVPSVESVLLVIVWAALIIILTFIGVMLSIGIGFEGLFSRYPRFPLPEEFQSRGFRFDIDYERLQMIENTLKEGQVDQIDKES